MNDFELNKAIAEKLGFEYVGLSIFGDGKINVRGKGIPRHMVDYCNNWSDLMPLVVEHDIDFLGGVAGHSYDDGFVDNYPHKPHYNEPTFKISSGAENPQRALAECLLKVLEAQK